MLRLSFLVLAVVALLRIVAPAGGSGIASPDTDGVVGQFTSIELDDDGRPVVSYHDQTIGALKVLHCGDPDCTAGNTIAAPETGGLIGYGTSLALDDSGNPVVSYKDKTRSKLKLVHCGNPGCTASNSIAVADGALGERTSLVLDSFGYPVIAYLGPNGDMRVLHCDDPGCDSEAGGVTVEDFAGDDVSLALDTEGYPVASYSGGGAFGGVARLRVLHCDNSYCTNVNTIEVPDTDGTNGSHSSLVLDGAGNPVVSYYGGTGELRVLHCSDPACQGSNSITVPDDGPINGYTSIALDADGNPVVSYADLSGGLKVLHCGDPNCTTDNRTASPDSSSVGWYTSLALDDAGNPVVSYFGGDDDLRVLHCGTPDCTGAATTSGNVDCDGDVDAVDALKVLRYVAGLTVSQTLPCPGIGQGAPVFGDVDCNGGVNAVDALRILRHVAKLENNLPPECPEIGT
jgi:hypothetical protein